MLWVIFLNEEAEFRGWESDGHYQIITAEVPLANLHDYSTSLRSMSQGRGIFNIEFARYEDIPVNEARKSDG